jgi:hypothetical protein
MDQYFVLGTVVALLLVLVLTLNIQMSTLNSKIKEMEEREGSIGKKIDELLNNKK